jgi:hypothetical protein
MALTVALYTGNRPMGGVETQWDEVVAALAGSEHPLPLLRSITPEGAQVLNADDLLDLVTECDRLLPATTGSARWTLIRVRDLTAAALTLPGSELRLIGSRRTSA